MNLYLRVLSRLLRWIRGGPPIELLEESVLQLRVWPTDLDLNGHMNNGRYLTVMDLGRLDLVARLGVLRLAARYRWRPVVAAAAIRFRRSLPPLRRYELRTRLICWDEKWWFVEQRFVHDGVVAAIALVRVLVRGPAGPVSPSEVLAALGIDAISPPPPEAVALWRASEDALRGGGSIGKGVHG
ncbi:MAG: hypothetical protein NVS4B3_15920 [Gemmatimonadaceae bacterium]